MTDAEAAWIAGIVEVKGSITTNGRRQPLVQVKMTEEDVVDRLRRVSGMGRVTGPHFPSARSTARRASWAWTVSRVDDVVTLLRHVWPLLGERRRDQVDALVERCRIMPPLRTIVGKRRRRKKR